MVISSGSRITRPVMVQMMSVSIMGPIMATTPSRTGSSVAAGALVLLVSPDGDEAASAVSGGTGAYVIRVPAPGEWSLRVERIGFASSTAGPFRLATSTDRTVPLAVSSVPVALPTITVERLWFAMSQVVRMISIGGTRPWSSRKKRPSCAPRSAIRPSSGSWKIICARPVAIL